MIKVIGITGGIGTGKSTAAEYLIQKGFAHIDADDISRKLTESGSDMLPVLDEIFGPEGEFGDGKTRILDDKGNLIRKALAAVVFSDINRKSRLDEIMFSRIIARIDEKIAWFKRHPAEAGKGVLLDAPLLFEAGLDSRCDLVLVLVADMDVRLARVCCRDSATPEEVRDRIKSQMSDNEKIKKADAVIDNSEERADLYESLDEFLREYFSVF